jgi:protocatechuate 3,4-dioxygenase beta subunit
MWAASFAVSMAALISALYIWVFERPISKANTHGSGSAERVADHSTSVAMNSAVAAGDEGVDRKTSGRGGAVRGHVVDEDNQPVSSAVISLMNRATVAVSDENGDFSFAAITSANNGVLARKGAMVGQAELASSPTEEPLLILLRPGVTLEVHVSDADTGVDIPGATVTGWGHHAITSGEGTAVLDGVLPGSEYFTMSASGYEQQSFYCHGAAKEHVSQTLKAKRGVPVNGLVLDDNGRPIAGAEVSVVNEGTATWAGTARSDAAGAWHIPAVGAGQHSFSAYVDSVDVAHETLEVPATGQYNVTLHQVASAEIRGTVTDAEGRTVPDATVFAPPTTTTTDGQGRFRIGVRQDRLVMWAKHGNRASALTVLSGSQPSEMEPLRIYETSISGLVLDEDREFMEGVRVELNGTDGIQPWRQTTDARGEFRFTGVPLGKYYLTARRPDDKTGMSGLAGVVIAEDRTSANAVMIVK